jgi:hypothetical protein
MLRKTTTIVLLLLIGIACEKPRQVALEPYIELEDITFRRGVDTLSNEVLSVIFGMHIEDGDANIAASFYDSSGAGFYLAYFEKNSGIYEPILNSENDTFTYYRIDPNGNEDIFDKVGLNKTLIGRAEIRIAHSTSFVNRYDTIAYKIYLQDQDTNRSNVEIFEDYPLTFIDSIVRF